MNFLTLDTLQFSKRLQKAGLDKKVSEELAEAIKETQENSTQHLATKIDMTLVRKDLTVLEQKIESLEHKLTTKIFLMLLAAVGAITWLDKVIN